jgi:hypothetical protein
MVSLLSPLQEQLNFPSRVSAHGEWFELVISVHHPFSGDGLRQVDGEPFAHLEAWH